MFFYALMIVLLSAVELYLFVDIVKTNSAKETVATIASCVGVIILTILFASHYQIHSFSELYKFFIR